MRPHAGTLAALSLAIALVSCGGGSDANSSQAAVIPGVVAGNLAAKSDAVADALDAGDVCEAARRADQLKDAVKAAISAGEVPPAFQGELERTATDLQNRVNCEEKDEEHGKGKKKGNDKDGTTTLGTTTLGTTSIGTTTGDGG